MKNTRLGRRCAVRLATAAVALTAAFMLAVMPAAAATINATDVTIRNTAEDKSDYSNAIGVLNTGDKVTVISKTTDGSGIEWYYIELENGNRGYVKAQWVDNGGEAVAEEEPAPATEETPEVNEEDVVDEEDIIDEEDVVNDDDWAGDPADLAEGTPASGDDTATAVTDADSQNAPEVENGQEYDPYTDPNAQYGINFSSEEDGTGSWYVYNYDTDKKIRIGDLEKLSDAQNAAQKNASAAGMWRTIACILLILLVALIIFLYLTLRRNSGPSPSARRRAQRRAAREEEDDEDEEDDFSDWDEDEDTDDGSAGADEADVTAAADDAEADDASAEADDFEEDADDLAEDEEEEPAPRKKSGGLFGGGKSGGRRSALFARAEEEDEEEDEEDDSYDEDDDSYDEEEDDDFYDDDSYDDEDEDEDEAPRKGGFFSMLKNIFSSDGLDDDYDDEDEDEDEEYEDDEYEDEEEEEELPPVRKQSRQSRRSSEKTEPAPRRRNRPAPKIEFDEEADYPEDVDLIPAAGKAVREEAAAVEEAAVEAEEATVEAAKAAVRKKNASANALRQPAPADLVDEDEDDDFYADDDDDMEYSFLNSSKRSSRK